tara:strand:+ start:293 stop:709 length:417 start_codon:yes stop_codon:yes gene_type:complete
MKELFFSTILPGDTDLGLSALTLQQVDDFLVKNKRDIDWDIWFSIIENITNEVFGKSFSELDQNERMNSIDIAQRKNFRLATNIIVTCLEIYYTNPDVLVAIGASPTLPYEQGQVIDGGNWDILDPVSQRGQMYRDVH